jgi:hypothetical protein
VLSILSTTVQVDPQHHATVQLGCGTGAKGCAGTVTAVAGSTRHGTVPFTMKEESTRILTFPTPLPAGTRTVTYTVHGRTGVASSSPTDLPVQG